MFTKKESGYNNNTLIELLHPFVSTLPEEPIEEDEFFLSWVNFCVGAFEKGDLDSYYESLVLDKIAQRLKGKDSFLSHMDKPTLSTLFTEFLLLTKTSSVLENLSVDVIVKKVKAALEEYPKINVEHLEEQLSVWHNSVTLKWVKEKIEHTNSNPLDVVWQAYNLGLINDSYCEDTFYKCFQEASASKSGTLKIIQDNDSVLLSALSDYLTNNNIGAQLTENGNKISAILGCARTDINAHSNTNQLFYKTLWAFLLDKELEGNPGMYHSSASPLTQKHLYLTVNQSNALDADNKEKVLKLIELNKFETLIINHDELTVFYFEKTQGILINDKFMNDERVNHINKVSNLIQEEEKQKLSQVKTSFGFYYLAPVEERLEKLAQTKNTNDNQVESHGVSLV